MRGTSTAVALASVLACSTARAIDYTWASATTGGLWSGTANWTPNSGSGGPTGGDAVVLDATASGTSRTVTIDSTAWGAATSGTIASLTISQTNTGTNTLDVGKNFRVTNAISLGASNGGTARITVTPQAAANVTATFSGGISLNSGGVLVLNFLNPSGTFRYQGDVSSNVTVQGGLLLVDSYQRNGTGAGSQQNTLTGSLTMTSGTVLINSLPSGSSPGTDYDRRLRVTGNLAITGGVVQSATTSGGGLFLDGASNTFQPGSIVNAPTLTLQGSSDQSLLTNQVNQITARGGGVKTLSSSLSGTNLGALILVDGNNGTASSRTTVRLGSDLTLQSGRALPTASNLSVVEATTLRVDVGIDAASYTLDLTATNAVFQPNSPFVIGSGTTTYWAFTGTTGRIIANGFNFTGGANEVATSVGPGLILESRSGNSVANILSLKSGTGTLTIDPTSTFRYSGTAAEATPSTLASTRSIGNLAVTSGALTLVTLTGSAANLAVSGGLLNLGTNSRSVAAATFSGGTVSSGTLTTYAGGYAGGAAAGATATVSAILSGTSGLVQSGSGTLVLSGVNDYAGTTTVSAGSLRLASATAIPGGIGSSGGTSGITFSGGVVDLATDDFLRPLGMGAAAVQFAGTGGFAATGGPRNVNLGGAGAEVTWGTGSFVPDGESLILSGATANDTVTFVNPIALGASTRTVRIDDGSAATDAVLSGTLSGVGGGLTKQGAGTLVLTAANTFTGLTTISAGTLALGAGGATGSIAGDVTNDGTLTFNRSDAVTFAGAIGGTGVVRQEGSGRLTLSTSNAYQGGTTVVGTGTLAITSASAIGTGTITLRTSRNDTANVFEIGASGTLANPIVIDVTGTGRNNIAVTSGSAVLAGPINVVGTASVGQIFSANGSGFEIRGNITGTSFANMLSFRGATNSTGVISGTVNAPSATVEVNGSPRSDWLVTSTGNVWATTQIGGGGSFIVGATDALPAGLRVSWFQTPTGGIDLNGFNQSVAGLDSGTTAAGAGRVTNNSAAGDSTLTLAGLAANYEFRGPVTDGTNGRKLAVVMNSAGRMQTLSGTNAYSGGTTLTAGTIGLGNVAALGTGTLTINGNGSLQSALATGTFANPIAISTGVTGTFDTNGNTSTFSGPIAGPGGLAKAGAGTLVLSASNTMGSGTLLVGGSSATDFGYITLANSNALGSYTAASLTQTGAGTSGINLTGGVTITQNLLTGGRNNANTTGYTLRSLSGSNAWNGNISINNSGGSYGFGADAGATLVIGGTVSTTVSSSARNFQVFGSGTTIVSGRLVGTSSTNSFNILKGDSGTLVLSSSNAYQGNTTLNQGTIAFGNSSAFGTSPVFVSSTGGVIRADVNSATIANAITLNVTGTFDTQANTSTVSGTIGGAGAFVKAGAGTLVLTASNGYTGGTTISSGTLQLGSDTSTGSVAGNIANGGTLVFRRSNDVTFSGTISGTGSLTKSGAGRVTLTAANTFTGNVTIGSAGNSPNYALRLENSEALGPTSTVKSVSVTGNNQSTSTLELAGGVTIDANKTLFTTGHSFFQNNSNTRGTPVFLENVSGSNAWLGDVIINGGGGSYSIESAAGMLVLGAEGTSSVLKNEVASTTRTFDFRGPGSTVVYSRLTAGTTSGAVTGVNMYGTGTLTIVRIDNDFAYAPLLSVGTTRIASLSDSGSASSLGTGATVSLGGTLEHLGGTISTSNRVLAFRGAAPAIVASGSGPLALTSGSAVAYQDATAAIAYAYAAGATTIEAADVSAILPGFTISGTGIAANTTITAVNYDTRELTLSQATSGALATSGTVTFGGQTTVARSFVLGGTNAGTSVFAPQLVDKDSSTAKLSLTKNGSGVWAITGSNIYTGSTSIEAGTLRIGNGGTAGSIGTTSGITVASGALLAFNRTDRYGGAFDRLISGAGGVRVESGFLELTAANIYSGNTTVLAGGTIAVNGSLANAALLVESGAALMGSGTILGDTTIQGAHMPGNSPGIETFANLTYSGSTPSITWELWGNTVNNSPVAYDQIVVTGDLTFVDPTLLYLAFTGTGSGVNWSDTFWDTSRQWVLHDVTGTTTNPLSLSVVQQNWADSVGNLFQTTRPNSTFTVVKDSSSSDMLIVYAAVPEPGSFALAVGGLLAAGWMAARRRSGCGARGGEVCGR